MAAPPRHRPPAAPTSTGENQEPHLPPHLTNTGSLLGSSTTVALLTAAIIVAALAIRTAIADCKAPGHGRRQRRFLTDRYALTAVAVTAVLLGLIGWQQAAGEGLVRALVAGALIALAVSPISNRK